MIWTISNLIKSFGELDLGCLVIYQTKNTSLLYVNIQQKKLVRMAMRWVWSRDYCPHPKLETITNPLISKNSFLEIVRGYPEWGGD